MKIPKSVKVGPHKFSVRYDREACVLGGVVGACMEDENKIILSPTAAASQQRETLLHEVLHAVWGQTWMDKEFPDDAGDSKGEAIVKELALHFLSLLRDNSRLVAFLTEEEK